MKIKYESDGNHCFTNCPFGKNVVCVGAKDTTIRVGSLACQSCENNMVYDKVKQEVECSYGERIKAKMTLQSNEIYKHKTEGTHLYYMKDIFDISSGEIKVVLFVKSQMDIFLMDKDEFSDNYEKMK